MNIFKRFIDKFTTAIRRIFPRIPADWDFRKYLVYNRIYNKPSKWQMWWYLAWTFKSSRENPVIHLEELYRSAPLKTIIQAVNYEFADEYSSVLYTSRDQDLYECYSDKVYALKKVWDDYEQLERLRYTVEQYGRIICNPTYTTVPYIKVEIRDIHWFVHWNIKKFYCIIKFDDYEQFSNGIYGMMNVYENSPFTWGDKCSVRVNLPEDYNLPVWTNSILGLGSIMYIHGFIPRDYWEFVDPFVSKLLTSNI